MLDYVVLQTVIRSGTDLRELENPLYIGDSGGQPSPAQPPHGDPDLPSSMAPWMLQRKWRRAGKPLPCWLLRKKMTHFILNFFFCPLNTKRRRFTFSGTTSFCIMREKKYIRWSPKASSDAKARRQCQRANKTPTPRRRRQAPRTPRSFSWDSTILLQAFNSRLQDSNSPPFHSHKSFRLVFWFKLQYSSLYFC